MTYSGTRFSGLYLLVQGTAISGWWVWLCFFPEYRLLFVPTGASEIELVAFALPDLLIAAVTSLIAALLFFVKSPWVIPIAWLSAGSVIYAATYCISWALLRGSGWLNVSLMLPAALLATIAALDSSVGVVPVFRRANASDPLRHIWATALQILVFWSFFLGVVPILLYGLQARLVGPSSRDLKCQLFAVLLFILFSAVGLASGFTMASRGGGTPLPFDATNQLVVAGPYAHIRNPMIVAGLGQGAAVSLWLGSWLVLAYVVLGSVVWQFLVRPAEEADLEATFGEEYRQYRDSVPCWFPRLARNAE